MLFARHRILDRFDTRFTYAPNMQCSFPPFSVTLKVNRRNNRFENIGTNRGENLEDRPTLGTAGHRDQSVALPLRGPLVEDQLPSTVAFVDRPRPGKDARKAYPIQSGVTEVPLS